MKKKGSIIITLILMLLFALAACGSSDENNSEANESNKGNESNEESDENELELIDPGKIVIASLGELKPFSYMEDGEMIGYDIDVAKAIAEKMGLEAQMEKVKLAGIITGVQQNRYDIAVASLTITDKRKEEVNFSDPYYYSGPGIYTRPDSDIKTADDLHDKEISIARGSSYISIGEEYTDNIPQVDNDVVALQALAKGHHDAVITDVVIGDAAIKNGIEIERQEQLDSAEQAVVVAKEDSKLLEAVNKALEELKEDGTLKEISMKWHEVDITEPQEN